VRAAAGNRHVISRRSTAQARKLGSAAASGRGVELVQILAIAAGPRCGCRYGTGSAPGSRATAAAPRRGAPVIERDRFLGAIQPAILAISQPRSDRTNNSCFRSGALAGPSPVSLRFSPEGYSDFTHLAYPGPDRAATLRHPQWFGAGISVMMASDKSRRNGTHAVISAPSLRSDIDAPPSGLRRAIGWTRGGCTVSVGRDVRRLGRRCAAARNSSAASTCPTGSPKTGASHWWRAISTNTRGRFDHVRIPINPESLGFCL